MTSKDARKIRMQRQVAYEKIQNGIKSITYSDCALAVDYDGQIIASIPTEFITEELCLSAIKNNYSNKNLIQYFPKTILTPKLALQIVGISGTYLKYLPLESINKDVILKAVKKTPQAIKYIPEKYKTDAIYLALFDISPKMIKYIESPTIALVEYMIDKSPSSIHLIKDTSILTPKMFEKAVMADWKNLKFVPAKRISKNLCECAFKSNWKAFKFFPNKFKTQELCDVVTDKDVSFLQYCPDKFLSERLCIKCLTKKGTLLEFVPEKLKSENLCWIAIENDCEAIPFVPQAFLTNEFYIKALKKHWTTIKYIPDELKSFELYQEMLTHISFSKTFREWLLSNETYCFSRDYEYDRYIDLKRFVKGLSIEQVNYEVIKKERELGLRIIINSSYDKDNKQFYVNELHFKAKETHNFDSFSDFYSYLGANLVGSNLTEYDFEGLNLADYNLDGAYLCSKILIKQGSYDGEFYKTTIMQFSDEVSTLPVLSNETIEAGLITHAEAYSEKLNSYDRKVYYITDIHLNHRLIEQFPQFATYDEIRFYIQKYIRKMLASATDKSYDDYLLIGGDVSFCFDISKIFYTELCKLWKPSNIVVVLGNHELWNFNRFGKKTTSKSLEQIFEQYQLFFKSLGISFLQNSLLIGKRNIINTSIILTEKDILEKSVEELRSLSLDSNFLLFGNLGFSAYNSDFNATHGIYRHTITTIEDDLTYTQQGEQIYKKLRETFSEDKVIILSHMPIKDWTKDDLVPNWIYVSGHTHHNNYILSEECTVYSDNQMGYKSKSVGLKYFKTSFHYDIFKYYSDGIYQITKAQYIEFNNGNGTRCTFNREVEYILMLKRQGVYLFLLEDKENKKLFLLNGGVTNRLKIIDVNYYYDNMIKYSDYIKMGMKKYNEALKSISDVVKKIGGDGTIHGCIVDIDFYNHIYLNPQDGAISAYYSPWFGDRYEYSTVEQLLEQQLPQLHANYKNLIGISTSLVVMSNIDITTETTHIIDTSQYKPSRLIKRLQYITESNVIRIWSDDFISNQEQLISNKKLLK